MPEEPQPWLDEFTEGLPNRVAEGWRNYASTIEARYPAGEWSVERLREDRDAFLAIAATLTAEAHGLQLHGTAAASELLQDAVEFRADAAEFGVALAIRGYTETEADVRWMLLNVEAVISDQEPLRRLVTTRHPETRVKGMGVLIDEESDRDAVVFWERVADVLGVPAPENPYETLVSWSWPSTRELANQLAREADNAPECDLAEALDLDPDP